MLHLQSLSTTLRSVRTHGESYTGTSTKMTPATLEYAYQFADDGYQTLIQTSQVSGQSPATARTGPSVNYARLEDTKKVARKLSLTNKGGG